MKKIRIGMIGCGQIMPATAKGILKSDYCVMQYLYDVDQGASYEKYTEFSVPVEKDLWKLLGKEDVDAVYIAVPHALHAPLAVEAARAGKHVMVEKPMATNVADAKMMVEECKKAGVTLSVAMGMRFDGKVKLARELIQKGAIGDVTSTRIHSIGFKDSKYWSNGVFGQAKRSAWRAYKGMAGGGILIMNAVHNLDAMYYMTELKPVEVMSMGGTYAAEAAVEDAISILIRYDSNNAYGVCEAMSSAYGAGHTDNSTVIYGTKGVIRFASKAVELYTTVESLGYETGAWVNLPAKASDSRKELMDDFAQAILSRKKPLITGEDGLLIVDTIYSAYLSMETGKIKTLYTASR